MGVGYNPRIVTDGLVLCLDAANKRSYPGSGTTWTDKVGGNDGTLTNGPTFSSDNGGSVVFDGANDYINVGNNSDLQITSEITLSAWIKGSPQSNKGIAGKYSAGAGQRGYLIATQQASPNNKIIWYYQRATSPFNAGDSVTSSLNVLDSNWHFILCTFTPSVSAKIYIDGELNVTDTVDIQSASANNSTRFDIGTHDQSTGYSFIGNISNVSVYNRALTAKEILQNYEATKGRYA